MTIAVVGAGSRGTTYARLAGAHGAVMVAVADPDPAARQTFGETFGVPADRRFSSVGEMVAAEHGAVAAINASPDRAHVASLTMLVEAGLDVLQEKPVGVDLAEIDALERLAAAHPDRLVAVCHVLRYTDVYREVKRIVAAGELGDVVTVHHSENVAHWHFAHSYVRGNWRSAAESSPMILAKCCHDVDLLRWLLDDEFSRVWSTGALRHFRSDQAPPGATRRCTDGCPVADDCAFDASRFYGGTPFRSVAANPQLARSVADLTTSPYGRCVYHCDNDVPDHQIATFEMTSGRSVVLTISGHAPAEGRFTRIDGTLATLEAEMSGEVRRIVIRGRGRPEPEPRIIDLSGRPGDDDGHGGGDAQIVADFLDDLRVRRRSRSDLGGALPGHRAALCAEESRLTGHVVEIGPPGG